MTKDEFKQFFKYINSVTTDTNPSPEKTQVYWDTVNDIAFEVAMVSARKVIATLENPFLPMPSVFRKTALQVTGLEIQPWPDAYSQVLRAVSNFGVHRTERALESLTPICRAAVKSLGGWQAFCANEENETNRAQFRMAYEALEKREMTDAKTPQKLKDLISVMGNSPILKLTESPELKEIRELDYQGEDDKTDSVEDIIEKSNRVRELLAKAAKNRRGDKPPGEA